MLSTSVVKALLVVDKDETEEKFITVAKAKELYDDEVKKGGINNLKLLTYNPNSKSFNYQVPVSFNVNKQVSKSVCIEVDCDKINFISSIPITSKILLKHNNIFTSIAVGGLFAIQNSAAIKIAFATNVKQSLDKLTLEFLPIKRIFDATISGKVETPEKKKKGRPSKKAIKEEVAKKDDIENIIYQLETRDGSMFVCDNFIIK